MKASLVFLLVCCMFVVTAFNPDHYPSVKNGNIDPFTKQSPTTWMLTKRWSRSDKKKRRDCRNRVCSLYLKKCPKACPQSCGYLNSPDPCCPLLGKPTCPDY